MAKLFDCSPDNISLHLKNIYMENELDEAATTEDFSVVQTEGARKVTCYSLEAIISIGYRVNFERGTQFRQWAISILREYIQKVFALDSDRFKYGSRFSTRYFDGLLEEIRDIRSSERMLYQKITDIYATAIVEIAHVIGLTCLLSLKSEKGYKCFQRSISCSMLSLIGRITGEGNEG